MVALGGTNTSRPHVMSGYLLSSRRRTEWPCEFDRGPVSVPRSSASSSLRTASLRATAPGTDREVHLEESREGVAARGDSGPATTAVSCAPTAGFFRDGRALDYVAELLDARASATRVTLILKRSKSWWPNAAAVARSALRQHGVVAILSTMLVMNCSCRGAVGAKTEVAPQPGTVIVETTGMLLHQFLEQTARRLPDQWHSSVRGLLHLSEIDEPRRVWAAMQHRGVRRGDRVAISWTTRWRACQCYGTLKIGAVLHAGQ